jgi:hypothetical protein
MNTATIIILNGALALGFLASLAAVMLAGHRAAGSEQAGSGHWAEPLQLEGSRRVESDLERAA